jgi:predicted acylesterase/phospholipase RssA
MGVQPVGVAGGSIGALVGALYALGMSANELTVLKLGTRVRAAIRPKLSRDAVLDPKPFADLMDGLFGDSTFRRYCDAPGDYRRRPRSE